MDLPVIKAGEMTLVGGLEQPLLANRENPQAGNEKMKMYIKWKETGEQLIDVKFQNSKIVANPDVFMRIFHIFLEGYPEYEIDMPNEYEPNIENNIPMHVKITIFDSIVCLFDNSQVFACKSKKIVFIYQTSHINSVKIDMYRALKEFLRMKK
jgi:hypothetical protein